MIEKSDAEKIARTLRRLYPRRRVLSVLTASDESSRTDFTRYRDDPVGFCLEVLGDELVTPDQRQVLSSLAKGRRVKVNSGHNVGKTWTASRATIWWFYTRNPGVVVSTAPTRAHVETVLWTEIRLAIMRARVSLPDHLLPKAPKLYDHPDHWAEGITAASREGFHGRHRPSMLFVFDECHDDKTEVMTEWGWMKFADLTGQERLMTMDQATHEAEYLTPVRVVSREHDGDMYEYKCNGVDFCVTPGHRMLYQKPGSDEWRLSRMEEVASRGSEVYMSRAVKWAAPDVDEFILPALRTDRKTFPETRFPMDDWLRLLGWYFSEGHLGRAANGQVYGFGITQKDPTAFAEIVALCRRLGLSVSEHLGASTSQIGVNGAHVARWLAQWGETCLVKRLPDFLRTLSVRQIKIFLDVYSRGDGYAQRRGMEVIYTSSKEMADDLHELVLMSGSDSSCLLRMRAGSVSTLADGRKITATADGWAVTRLLDKQKRIKFRTRNLRKFRHRGRVWCAELPRHNLLLTRRNGRVLWSGNCEGVDAVYWNATDTMYIPGQDHAWLAIGNPYTTSTQSYLEDMATDRNGKPKWDVISLSALNHPNVIAELAGKPPVVPNAVSVHQIDQWVHSRCTPVDAGDVKPRDVEWPPARPCPKCQPGVSDVREGESTGLQARVEPGQTGSPPLLLQSRGGGGVPEDEAGGGLADQMEPDGCPDCGGTGVVGGGKWWRPGPWFLAACMGIRPSGGIDTVWGEDVWNVCIAPRPDPHQQLRDCWLRRFGITIGVDASGYGDDDTVFHVRSGPVSLHHEAHNGWGPAKSAGRIKELCVHWAGVYDSWASFPNAPKLSPTQVEVVLEFDGGYGIGVHSHRGEFVGWRGVTVGGRSEKVSPSGTPMYYNLRSEIWCEAAALGAGGLIDLSRLPQETLDRMRIQLLTPYYEVLPSGARRVESKDEVKARLKRSPDDADGFLLSHHRVPNWSPEVVGGRDD